MSAGFAAEETAVKVAHFLFLGRAGRRHAHQRLDLCSLGLVLPVETACLKMDVVADDLPLRRSTLSSLSSTRMSTDIR